MTDHATRAREIVRQFGFRSDCEMSLADMQWLTTEIRKALEQAAQEAVWSKEPDEEETT